MSSEKYQVKNSLPQTLVIFDIDGTLLYSNKIDSQCFALTYEEIYKKKFPTIDWSYFPAVSDTVIFETIIKEHFDRLPTTEEIMAFQQQYVNLLEKMRVESPQDFLEVPGAKKLVERLLVDENYIIGIGTGGWLLPAKVKLRHIGLNPNDFILSTADGKYSREAILQQVLDVSLVQHSTIDHVVYFGDAEWDVKTTRNMGMKFVGVRREGDHNFLLNMGAKHVLTNYTDHELFHKYLRHAEVPQ